MAGRSVEELRRESGLMCTRMSLHRKLFGYGRRYKREGRVCIEWAYQSLTFEEVQALARPLGLRVDLHDMSAAA